MILNLAQHVQQYLHTNNKPPAPSFFIYRIYLFILWQVMILNLAQHVQQYLHTNNKPPAPSFYEEMMSNKRKQEERLAEEQQRKLEVLKRKEEKEVGPKYVFPIKCWWKLRSVGYK